MSKESTGDADTCPTTPRPTSAFSRESLRITKPVKLLDKQGSNLAYEKNTKTLRTLDTSTVSGLILILPSTEYGAPRFKPGMAGWEAPTFPQCYPVPLFR